MRTKNGFFSGAYIVLNILSATFLTLTATAATQFSNEFWVSTSTNTANLGTLSDPYDGSTQVKFDNVMANLPAYSTVHILAGTYVTAGNISYNLKTGQKVLGSGMDVTIVRLAAGTSDQAAVFQSSVGTNVVIQDLTADCNYSSGSLTYNGIALIGTANEVRRVKVINGAGFSPANTPFFGVNLLDATGGPQVSEGNIVEECEISQFKGGTGWGFGGLGITMGTVNGEVISGTVLNNRIFLPGTNGIAIKGANTCNWLVQGNYVSGGWAGFYGDSGTYSNMLVAHNVFKNCYTAVSLTFNTRQNLTFSYNTIQLPTNASASAFSFNGLASTNIVITGNNVGFSGARAGTNYFIFGASIAGLLVNNNTVDPACTNYFTACSGVNIYDNFDLNGNSLTTLNQVEPPNGITRTTVNATPYAASYADYYIGVKTTSATALSLPTAVGHPGKEYIIMKEVSNTNNVTITPAGTEKINGSTNLVINTGFANKEVVSDGTNWFAR